MSAQPPECKVSQEPLPWGLADFICTFFSRSFLRWAANRSQGAHYEICPTGCPWLVPGTLNLNPRWAKCKGCPSEQQFRGVGPWRWRGSRCWEAENISTPCIERTRCAWPERLPYTLTYLCLICCHRPKASSIASTAYG